MDKLENDKRFSHVTKDMRFRKIPRRDKKVKIDKRFQSMFTDERFQLKSAVDKRGRPHIAKGSEHLQRYYDFSESEVSDDGTESDKDIDNDSVENQNREKHSSNVTQGEVSIDDVKEVNNVDDESSNEIITSTKTSRKMLDADVKAKLRDLVVDYARGEGVIESESSSDEDTSSEEEEEEVDHDWGEMDRDANTTEKSTNRIALCNMDWDRITAQDIMVLINSFLPPGGILRSVTIYPSEFGLKRIKEEEEKGPTELSEMPEVQDQEDDELSIEQREKLREYQLKRLKYFYAVLVFDSERTADHIYKECDGLEYESSMNRLDLRFVPDDTEFDQAPREECHELPDLTSYKPRLYRTTALTQVKVDLTWDETDPVREEMIRAAHQGKLDDAKLDKFLASSSSEDEDQSPELSEISNEPLTEKKAIEKYKSLLANLTTEDEKDKDVAMEVTWDLKLEQDAAEKVKNAAKSDELQTPFEKFIQKKKEKKKLKKVHKKDKVENDSDDNGQPFSDDDVPSDIDMNDPYFKQELVNTKNNKATMKKGKKLVNEENEGNLQEQAELELLMLDEVKEESKQHFSMKKITETEKKSKKRRKFKKKPETAAPVQDNFKINVDDERFSAMFSSHLYNVDPAAPNFKATDGMKALIGEKQKRKRPETESISEENNKVSDKRKRDAELNLLVKSVKRKTEAVKNRK